MRKIVLRKIQILYNFQFFSVILIYIKLIKNRTFKEAFNIVVFNVHIFLFVENKNKSSNVIRLKLQVQKLARECKQKLSIILIQKEIENMYIYNWIVILIQASGKD